MVKPSDQDFSQMIINHINIGNSDAQKSEPGVAGAALMHAAARFNAYVSSLQYVSPRIMQDRRQFEIDHYLKLYKEMLEQHYDEYVANYDQYRTPPKIG
ncbi:DUF3144 domain-containing protein [Asticcacaulis sp. YBE204]|uniref:DUF3144 domain-containing protein n=1 Tax=Asticcacaulis sp. YBE204 TaxID=1282363 RepID=UPI0003C3D4AB|nr:DUF3144 domain-containing protein [Asticcacaulis sp. YBE204]ESQ77804.1 hypothetical protein AEYBE204_16880 [Asticcacaulis sp. YBE204]